jgi:hypothetical protein
MVVGQDYSVLALNHPRNIIFQTMLINTEGLFVPNILYAFALYGK